MTVVCGPSERDPEDQNNVVNPKLIVEVLSDGTEHCDRMEKLEHYQQIPSLEACVLVSHRERLFEVWSRKGGQWVRTEGRSGAQVELAAIGCSLDVDAIYERASE